MYYLAVCVLGPGQMYSRNGTKLEIIRFIYNSHQIMDVLSYKRTRSSSQRSFLYEVLLPPERSNYSAFCSLYSNLSFCLHSEYINNLSSCCGVKNIFVKSYT
jgi:hypothetical protein